MELPKNITQIGEPNKNCKIYAEDYVVSYIKQMNQRAKNKDLAVALYGRKRVDGEVAYLFLYGACKLDFLQRETRHLSQAQLQEIEKLRKKYFAEYEFQGYRLLNGEMVEGYHICEQGICRYISGYAQFYEKNDAMLAYMLDAREAGSEPETVSQEKYDTVRRRQDERKEEYRSSDHLINLRERKMESAGNPKPSRTLGRMKLSAAAVFVLICGAGVALLWDGENTETLQAALGQAVAELTEQKLPDAENLAGEEQNGLVTEDKLTEALQQENAAVVEQETAATETTPAETAPVLEDPVETAPSAEEVSEPAVSAAAGAASAQEPITYVIQQKDTLIGISIRQYGSDSKVSEICALNQISDPDDIKVGQKILLP